MHALDTYERQHTRPAHTHAWTPRVATKQYVCTCGAVRVGVVTFAELKQAERIDVWNRAMRTAKSRRKFILTGEV